MPEKRNIVLITLDSLRADHCSFMDYHRKTTPTMDKMARKGLVFKKAIVPSVATAPSLMAMFTNEYTFNNLQEFKPNKCINEISRRRTFAQELLEKGYTTVAFNPNPAAGKYFGFNKGFEFFKDFFKHEYVVSNSDSVLVKLKKLFRREHVFMSWEDMCPSILNWIEGIKPDKPFFLWILLLDTHEPYWIPRWKWKNVPTNKLNNVYQLYLHWRVNQHGCRSEDKKEAKKIINAYDSATSYADEFVNKLKKDLKEHDPIIIIHGDHGTALGEHGYYFHPPYPGGLSASPLYHTLIHVPFIIYNADVKGKINKPVSLINFYPSMIELVNGKEEEFLEGFLGNENWVISKVLDNGKRKIAVTLEDWKFITGQGEKDELYYFKEDFYEQENLIDEKPKLVEEMRKIIENHIRQEMEKRRVHETVSRFKREKPI